jgi:hypothetical protein
MADHLDEEVGLGPHPVPWPEGDHYDPELLRDGDRRNVLDTYRYWRREAIIADLDLKRHPFHVAIENWQHDLNIGTVVRNANAFLAAAVHIVGQRKWNRRGAMVTDRYQRSEGKTPPALHHLRYTIDIDHPRFAKPVIATISGVVFASTIVASAVTSIVVSTIWIWVLVNVSHHWFLELQPGVAGCVGEGRYTAVVFVSSAVKNHRFDASCFCAFS